MNPAPTIFQNCPFGYLSSCFETKHQMASRGSMNRYRTNPTEAGGISSYATLMMLKFNPQARTTKTNAGWGSLSRQLVTIHSI